MPMGPMGGCLLDPVGTLAEGTDRSADAGSGIGFRRLPFPRIVVLALAGGFLTSLVTSRDFVVAVLATLVAAPLLFLGASLFGSPRLKAWAWGHFPTIPTWLGFQPPLKELAIQPIPSEWLTEHDSFLEATYRFWESLRHLYGRYGGFGGHVNNPDGLTGTIEAALWPDQWLAWQTGQNVKGVAQAMFLKDFTDRAYQLDRGVIEKERHAMSMIVRRWWLMAEGDGGTAFRAWIRKSLQADSVRNTTKLMWFVEVAHAEAIGRSNPTFEPYEFMRELLGRE